MHSSAINLYLSVMLKISGHACEPRLHTRGRVRCEPGWNLGPGWASGLRDYDLWFVWAGRGRMWLDRGEIALRPGTCLWMRPGHRYEAEQDAAEPLGVNYIHFELMQPGHASPLAGFSPPFELLHTRQLELTDHTMRRVIELGTTPPDRAVAQALLGGLLMALAHEHATGSHGPGPGTDQHHRDVILRVAAQIRENPGQIASVVELARAAGYSVDHFSRLFLKVTGLRPQHYVIQARIARARQLLAESDLTIGMVAEALGFQDIFYFSRQFRQQTQQTPTEFRRGLRRA
jgi:AraC-like DNA-binding protein